MASNAQQQVTILMIEDDLGHARLIEKNIRRAGVLNEVIHAADGTTALSHLNGTLGQDGHAFLVLLDLNLPDMSGTSILEHMKSDPHLKRFPVIVLTTTDDEREIQRCYDLGANAYMTKPVAYEAFTTAIRQLGLFLAVIQVPGTDDT